MAYNINFSLQLDNNDSRDELYDLLAQGLNSVSEIEVQSNTRQRQVIKFGDQETVTLNKATDHKIHMTLKANSENVAQQEIAALFLKLSNNQKTQVLNQMFQAQPDGQEKVLIGKMKEAFETALAKGLERQKQQLATGKSNPILNMANAKKPKAKLELAQQEQAKQLKINNQAIAAQYEALLKAEIEKLNQANPGKFKHIFDNSGEYMIAGLSGSKGNQLDVNLRNGFSATTDVINNETSLMMVAAANTYYKAFQKTHAQQAFPGFVLSCETQQQAQVFQALFERDGIPLQRINVTQTGQSITPTPKAQSKDQSEHQVEPKTTPLPNEPKTGRATAKI